MLDYNMLFSIPDWMLKDLLGIDKQEVIRGLQSIRVPDNQYDAK